MNGEMELTSEEKFIVKTTNECSDKLLCGNIGMHAIH
jgi:hypothetical protein